MAIEIRLDAEWTETNVKLCVSVIEFTPNRSTLKSCYIQMGKERFNGYLTPDMSKRQDESIVLAAAPVHLYFALPLSTTGVARLVIHVECGGNTRDIVRRLKIQRQKRTVYVQVVGPVHINTTLTAGLLGLFSVWHLRTVDVYQPHWLSGTLSGLLGYAASLFGLHSVWRIVKDRSLANILEMLRFPELQLDRSQVGFFSLRIRIFVVFLSVAFSILAVCWPVSFDNGTYLQNGCGFQCVRSQTGEVFAHVVHGSNQFGPTGFAFRAVRLDRSPTAAPSL